MRAALPLGIACVTAFWTTLLVASAHAQTTDAKNIAGARELANAGMKLQEERRYADCAEKFDAAHRLYPEATTVTIRWAQCLAASGKLVEAGEAYRVLAATSVASNAPAQFKQAQQQGKVESDALEARIPVLTLFVDPTPAPSGTKLHLQHAGANGQPAVDELDAAWIGLRRKINPGTYTVFATAPGYASKTKQVVLAEAEKKEESLTLSAGESAPVVTGTTTKVAGPNEPPPAFVGEQAPKIPSDGPTKFALILGGGGTFAATGGSDNIQGPTGFGHLNAWFRLNKLVLGAMAEYRSVPRKSGRREDAYYVGAHVGFISTPRKKVAFWLDGGVGVYGDEGSTDGLGAQIGLGPSFPLARTVRLITKGVLGLAGASETLAYMGVAVDLQFEIPFGKPMPIQ